MIQLSFNTIKDLYESNHSWINKQMMRKKEDKPWFKTGKDLHRVIQAHVNKTKLDNRLTDKLNGYHFSVVETKDYDEKTEFIKEVDYKGYSIHGYADGLSLVRSQILEIKTGTLWSPTKFKDSMQRKVYVFGFPEYIESVLITASSDLKKIKVYKETNTFQDVTDALAWIRGGIDIIEDIKNLVPPGTKCEGCSYGPNCYFL